MKSLTQIFLFLFVTKVSLLAQCTGLTALPDFDFVPDVGLRLSGSALPKVNVDPSTNTIYLFSDLNYYESPISDGLSFYSAFSAISTTGWQKNPSVYQFDNNTMFPWFRMFYLENDNSNPCVPMAIKSEKSTMRTSLTGMPSSATDFNYYETGTDNGSIGVPIFYKIPGTSGAGTKYGLIYVGDGPGRKNCPSIVGTNNLRFAESTDYGATFTQVDDNLVGDMTCPSSVVDPNLLTLPDGILNLFTMKNGNAIQRHISTNGYNFTNTANSVIEMTVNMFKAADPSNFDYVDYTNPMNNKKLLTIHDPYVVILPDGRLRMYLGARIGTHYHPVSDTYGTINAAVISATTSEPIYVSTNTNQGKKAGVSNQTTENIAQLEAVKTYSVLPNPANTEVTVQFESKPTQNTTISLVNISGITLWSINSVQRTETIITDDLPNGIYFLRVQEAEQISTQKIIIQH